MNKSRNLIRMIESLRDSFMTTEFIENVLNKNNILYHKVTKTAPKEFTIFVGDKSPSEFKELETNIYDSLENVGWLGENSDTSIFVSSYK